MIYLSNQSIKHCIYPLRDSVVNHHEFIYNTTMMRRQLDLHGCTRKEAKALLDYTLDRLPKGAPELVVIHGYSTTVLLNYVRKTYQHPRIREKMIESNPGQTVYLLSRKY